MRLAVLAALTIATTSSAHADDEAHRFAELAAISGPLVPSGAFIEQRICEVKRKHFIGCTHLLYGKQEGGTKKGNVVFDLYGTTGVVLHHGRFDLTSLAGVSTLTTLLYVGQWLIAPVTQEIPSAKQTFSLFPFEATGSVALGYTFVQKGRFRSRAELGVRVHVPIFTDSAVELPSPRGIGATLGVGAGF